MLGVLFATLLLGLSPSTTGSALAQVPFEAPDAAPAAPISRSEASLAIRGIYVQQGTAQDEKKLHGLIDQAKAAGVNTFVVDLWRPSRDYPKAIEAIQRAGLRFVPRITLFPDGASPEQVDDRRLLERRWRLIDHALELGAKDIQLDYIRFSSRNAPSAENASKILGVIRFFRQRIHERGAALQIDIFGEVSYAPSIRIGQDMRLFAAEIDAVCPMLYPSHFEPYRETAKAPYETVNAAILALERQTKHHPIPIYPFIEHFNYRYRMTEAERAAYFEAQLEAVLNSSAQGFYVWSVGNHYEIPFAVLQRRARERGEPSPVAGATPSPAHGAPSTPN